MDRSLMLIIIAFAVFFICDLILHEAASNKIIELSKKLESLTRTFEIWKNHTDDLK